jgi:uncharacterized protein YlxP (DUF503 family)
MFFALCRFELFIPEARSLKAKRAVINRVKDRLRSRFHASVSEVATQDLWQRGTIGIALVGLSPSRLEEGLAAMRRLIEQDPRCYITLWEIRVEPFTGGEQQVPAAAAPGDAAQERVRWFESQEGDELYGSVWNERKPPDAPRPPTSGKSGEQAGDAERDSDR